MSVFLHESLPSLETVFTEARIDVEEKQVCDQPWAVVSTHTLKLGQCIANL